MSIDLAKMKAELAALKQKSARPSTEEAEAIKVAEEWAAENERIDKETEDLLRGRAQLEKLRLQTEEPDKGPYECVYSKLAHAAGMVSVFVVKTTPPGAHEAYRKTYKHGKPLVDVAAQRAQILKSIASPDLKIEGNVKRLHDTLDKFPGLIGVLWGAAEELSNGAAEELVSK